MLLSLKMHGKDTRRESRLIAGVALSSGSKFNSEHHSLKKDTDIPDQIPRRITTVFKAWKPNPDCGQERKTLKELEFLSPKPEDSEGMHQLQVRGRDASAEGTLFRIDSLPQRAEQDQQVIVKE